MKFDFSEEKNLLIKEARGVGFEDVVWAIENGRLLDDIKHFNQARYPKQRIYILEIRERVYAVPYVRDVKRKITFLKTIYPSRKLKEKYIK